MSVASMIREIHSGVSMKAILFGLGTVITLSLVAAPLEIIFLFGPHLKGIPLLMVGLILGFLGTTIGAYVVARQSPSDQFLNVWLYWATLQLAGFVINIPTPVEIPLWYDIIGTLGVAGASLAGWYAAST
jgi:hypothetical protein